MARWVLHKHYTKRKRPPHYDIRFEVGNKLWSFALPKGLPKTSGKKVLAIKTDDHEKYWLNFEGEIEEGYGAGVIEIIDKGTFDFDKKSDDGFSVILDGDEYTGKYVFYNIENDKFIVFKTKNKENNDE